MYRLIVAALVAATVSSVEFPAGALGVRPALAQSDADARAAAEAVLAQLEAFRRDDFDAAYTFASATIKEIFDRQNFERMVRGGYPEIARSSVAFVSATRAGPDGTVYVSLRIRGTNGNTVQAVYEMVREDGRWRINGVVTRPASDSI